MATPLLSSPPAPAAEAGVLPLAEAASAKLVRVEEEAIRVTTCHYWQRLEQWLPDWEAILRENPSLSIFSTPEWLGSWWKAFGVNKQMIALILADASKTVVGLIPLYFDELRSPLLGKLAHLRLIGDGSGDSDNLDLIVRPGYERVCAIAVLNWLKNWKNWDVCSLNTFPEQSSAGVALMREIKAANWPILAGTTPNSAISLPQSWPTYVKSLSPNFRPLVERYPRRLAQRYNVRIRRWESSEELREGLDTLFSLHKKRWNQVNQPGSFGSRERREFYRLMGKSFLRRGWLEFWSLELNEVVVAAQYCFRYRDIVSILQEGFEPKYGADKVGYALRAAMLRDFIKRGVKRYDFLGGFGAHKQNWGAQPGAYLNLQFARTRSRGSLHLALTKSKTQGKEWLRSKLPPAGWQVLHWLKLHLTSDAEAPSA